MNRDIKFRAWNNKRGTMIESAHIYEDFCQMIGSKKDIYTVMQFTGLKDNFGTDIYEGDIVSYKGILMEVRFGSYIEAWLGVCPKDGHNAVGWFISDKEEGFIKSLLTDWSLPNMKGLVLMGNIYENPGLMPNEQDPERSVANPMPKELNDDKNDFS